MCSVQVKDDLIGSCSSFAAKEAMRHNCMHERAEYVAIYDLYE